MIPTSSPATLFRRKIALAATAVMMIVSTSVAHAQRISLLRDAEIEEFLDDYSTPLLESAGINPDAVDIYLVGNQTPNAFVAGGLNMFIHTGLLTLADYPNQVEGVIAHEIGHMTGGHIARSDDALSAATRPMLLSLVLAAGAIAAGAPEAGIGVLGLGQNIGLANYLRYSRGQESNADQAALTFLDDQQKSGRGLIEFFSKLRNSQIITGRRVNPYLQTHPLANQRITALTVRAEQSPHFDVEDSEEEIYRLDMIKAKIFGFLQETNVTLRQYPLSDQSDAAHYARAVAYYRSSQLDKAQSEIKTLTALYPDNPYFHELDGQMLFEFGKVAQSIEPHRRSVALAPDEALFRINLGRALIATEETANYEQAIVEIKRALLLEPDNGFGWFEIARAYSGLGNEPMANLATAESRYHAGAKGEANLFARRALAGLKKGTTEWRQAADVVYATQPKTGEIAPLPAGLEPDDSENDTGALDEPRTPDVPDPTFQFEHSF